MSVAKITSKGQVTIPIEVRKRLKLKPGDFIDFQVEKNGTVRIYPYSKRASEVYGLLAEKERPVFSTEEIDERLRKKFREGSL